MADNKYTFTPEQIVSPEKYAQYMHDNLLVSDPKSFDAVKAAIAIGDTQVKGFGGAVFAALEKAFGIAVNQVLGTLYQATGISTDVVLQVLKGNNIISGKAAETMEKFLHGTGLLEPLMAVLTLMQFGSKYSDNLFEALGQISIQELLMDARPSVPQIGDVLRAAFVSPGDIMRIREIGARAGIKETDIDLILKANYGLMDQTTIREEYFRIGKDGGWARKRLAQLGYTPEIAAEIMQTWDLIPGPQDLISMAVKEAFDDDFSRQTGADKGLPPDFVAWAGKQGLSADWALKYWRAHWQLPSPQQVYEMLHRGIVDSDTVSRYLRAADYAPYWRDKLQAISFRPYTRVDVKRMYKLSILDVDGVRRSYRDIGYDTDYAENMTRYTIKELQGINREPTKAEIIKSFVKRIIDETTTREMLHDLGYGNEETDFLVDLSNVERDRDFFDNFLKLMKESFLEGALDRDAVEQRMVATGVPADEISTLMELWDLEKASKRKKPTQAQLDKWYASKQISTDEYRREMYSIGWEPMYINLFLGAQSSDAVLEHGENKKEEA